MAVLVTGAAGFIGSSLVRALVDLNEEVIGVDCFLDASYDANMKRANADELVQLPGTIMIEADIRKPLPKRAWRGVDTVVNLAAMPGQVESWNAYDLYQECNVTGVQRLIDQSLLNSVQHFIQISTSSVYGALARGAENEPLAPISPYGVTKLAAENLVSAYGASLELPFTILRYFSVYGPGQRPDMAYHLLCETILSGSQFTVFGDGSQTRSNTHVSDVVAATILCIGNGALMKPFNVAGGEVVSLLDAISLLEDALGRTAKVRFEPERFGDQRHTRGDTGLIERSLGYRATMGVKEGLQSQADWHMARRRQRSSI